MLIKQRKYLTIILPVVLSSFGWCKITSYICLIGMIEIRRDPSIVPAPSVIEWNSLFELSFQCLWNPSLERSFEELDFSFPFPIWRACNLCHMGFNLSNIIRHFTDSKSRWWNDVYYLGKRIEKWLESNSVFLGRIHELEIERNHIAVWLTSIISSPLWRKFVISWVLLNLVRVKKAEI